MQAKAVLFTGTNQVSVKAVEIPEPDTGEVLVQAEYTCISPGTELRCLAGTLKEAGSYPYIPGYSMSGTIIAVGKGCTHRAGERVWCTGTGKANVNLTWGGHISHAIASESDLVPIPENVGMREASIGRLASIAYHGVRISSPLPHEKIALVGLGPIGMLSALLHAASGSEVVVADRVRERVALAEKWGLRAFIPGDSLAEGFRTFFPDGADLLIDATGLPSMARQLMPVGKDLAWDDTPYPRGARYLIMGVCDTDYTFPQLAAFDREMPILSSRDRQPRDTMAVLDLMSRGKLNVAEIISDIRDPDDAPQAYADLMEKRDRFMTIAFCWRRS
jgi:2-desacetyl-2-hydroxyethyl bacteriochlorophyllide A dehydrogenase